MTRFWGICPLDGPRPVISQSSGHLQSVAFALRIWHTTAVAGAICTANAFGRGCSSVVEHDLAKVGVEGSNPFARSKNPPKIRRLSPSLQERSTALVFREAFRSNQARIADIRFDTPLLRVDALFRAITLPLFEVPRRPQRQGAATGLARVLATYYASSSFRHCFRILMGMQRQ